MQYTTKAPAEASATPEAIIASEALPGGYSEPDYTADIEAAEAQIPDPPAGPEPFKLISFAECISGPPKYNWLIQDWIPARATVMLFAAPGSGKSFIAIDWALRIAAGIDTWAKAPEMDRPGFKVKPGAVVYLAGEGHDGIKKRFYAWAHHNEVKAARLSLSPKSIYLDNDQGFADACKAIDETEDPPVLVVIDTLGRHYSGNENDNKDANLFLDYCQRLIDKYACSVLLVHHTGKGNQTQARGASAFNGGADVEIRCSRDSNGLITLENTKNKDEELLQAVHFELHTVNLPGWFDEYQNQMKSAVVLPSAARPERDKPEGARKTQNVLTAEKAYEQAIKNAAEWDSEGQFLGVHLEAWRKEFYELTTIDKQGSKKTAFDRARQTLTEKLCEFSKNGDIYKRIGFEIVDNILAAQSGTRHKTAQNGTVVPVNTEADTGTKRHNTLKECAGVPSVPDDEQKPLKPNKGKKKRASKGAKK